jgi:hypothetical protein
MTNTMKNNNLITIEKVTQTTNYWGKMVTSDYGVKVHLKTADFETYVHFYNGGIVESLITENELLDLGLSHSQLFNYTK